MSSASQLAVRDVRGPLCRVCGDVASGFHYGVDSCEGCKGFFRRCITQGMTHPCAASESCEMTPVSRNSCQFCRLKKCYAVGMSRQASRLGRRPKHLKDSSLSCSSLFRPKPQLDASVTSGATYRPSNQNRSDGLTELQYFVSTLNSQDPASLSIHSAVTSPIGPSLTSGFAILTSGLSPTTRPGIRSSGDGEIGGETGALPFNDHHPAVNGGYTGSHQSPPLLGDSCSSSSKGIAKADPHHHLHRRHHHNHHHHHDCERYLKDAVAFIDRSGRVILNTSFCADDSRGATVDHRLPPSSAASASDPTERCGRQGALDRLGQPGLVGQILSSANFLAKRLERRRVCGGQEQRDCGGGFFFDGGGRNFDASSSSFPGSVLTADSSSPFSGSASSEPVAAVEGLFQATASLRRMLDEEVRQVPTGSRLQLVDHVISTVSEAHVGTCNYTSEKLTEGLRMYNEKMKGKPKLWDLEQMKESTGSYGPSFWWEQFVANMVPVIKRVVAFSKRLPGFSELSQEDKVILIKQGSFEVILARYTKLFSADGMFLPDMTVRVPRDLVKSMPLGDFFEEQFKFADVFNVLQLSDSELGILTGVMILNPDRDGLLNPRAVYKLRSLFLQSLYCHMQKIRPGDFDAHFEQTVLTLPLLSRINEIHSQKMQSMRMTFPDCRLPALHNEVFDSG